MKRDERIALLGQDIERFSAADWRYLFIERPDLKKRLAKVLDETPVKESSGPVIDLYALAWESIMQAASESKWMPEEYFQNDWVSDVCGWLRDGFPDPSTAAKPVVVVDVTGGAWHGVRSSAPVDVVLVDTDSDQSGTIVLPDGTQAYCAVLSPEADDIQPRYALDMLDAVRAAAASSDLASSAAAPSMD
ncbi:MAG: hypothetical protein ABIW82_16970 [Dokdonella sp.]